MNAPTLTAVVLNWRTPDLALRAARALITDGIERERLVIVDNASGDGSIELLRDQLPGSEILALEENIGFAGANNAGAALLPATEAYLFVNSDAFVHRNRRAVAIGVVGYTLGCDP
jgi:N-acetylglucosaminyl-diphospho-decaprenol L-rhamnosyltransferase